MPTTGIGHRNISCDGCQRHNFHGRRFKCLRCLNYDLCGDCYDQHVETQDHSVDHPMQLILENEELPPDVFLNGDLLELLHMPNCYTCPYCGIFGQTAKQLIDHVITIHRLADDYVVCPLCAGLPSIELVAIRNLARHLVLNHIEHANILDPNTPPLRLAIARSSRRHRRQQIQQQQQQQLQQQQQREQQQQQQQQQVGPLGPLNLHESNRRRHNGVDSDADIDILYQLTEISRYRPDLFPHLEASEEDTRSGNMNRSAIAAALEMAHGSPEEVTEIPLSMLETPTVASSRTDADRFLLQKWINMEQERNDIADQVSKRKEHHALFAEHLLLSMLSSEDMELPQLNEQPNEEVLSNKQTSLLSIKFDKQDDSPSKAMSLMSLPWTRVWKVSKINQFLEIEGVALDESDVKKVKCIHHDRYEDKEEDID